MWNLLALSALNMRLLLLRLVFEADKALFARSSLRSRVVTFLFSTWMILRMIAYSRRTQKTWRMHITTHVSTAVKPSDLGALAVTLLKMLTNTRNRVTRRAIRPAKTKCIIKSTVSRQNQKRIECNQPKWNVFLLVRKIQEKTCRKYTFYGSVSIFLMSQGRPSLYLELSIFLILDLYLCTLYNFIVLKYSAFDDQMSIAEIAFWRVVE